MPCQLTDECRPLTFWSRRIDRHALDATRVAVWKLSELGIQHTRVLPIVSIVVPFGGYLIGSLLYIWLNQKKELQWRL